MPEYLPDIPKMPEYLPDICVTPSTVPIPRNWFRIEADNYIKLLRNTAENPP